MAPERLTARRAKVRALFERALARGEISAPAEMEVLLDIVPAMILYRYNTRAQQVTRGAIERLVDGMLMPMLQPRQQKPRP